MLKVNAKIANKNIEGYVIGEVYDLNFCKNRFKVQRIQKNTENRYVINEKL